MDTTAAHDHVNVSVLTPVLNEGADIRATVDAMRAQQFPGAIEFIFADGRSEDDTRAQLLALAAEDPRIRLLDNPARGTAAGLNTCLCAARGDYVARMDAHTVYPPDYLARGVSRLQEGGTTWVAGPQVPVGRDRFSNSVADALGTWLGRGGSKKWSAADDTAVEEHDLDTGVFCGVWRRADVVRHGGWDEGWPRNQDSEMAARFLRAGERIVCVPAMAARYTPRNSLSGLWRQYRGYGRYRARTARRHPASLRPSAVLPPLLVLDAAAAVAAPRPLRVAARAGLATYAAAVLAAAAQAASRRPSTDAALIAPVLVTMHVAHGVGFLEGAAQWGVPWRGLARLAGVRRSADEQGPASEPVDAPTLAGCASGTGAGEP